jgi:hypothetical protein
MMGTITKQIADDVIAGKYECDRPTKIIKYTNAWGGEAFGLVCAHEDQDRYRPTEYVINPTVYWVHP